MTFIVDRRRLLAAGASGLLLAALPGRAYAMPTQGFTHGVASGDPGQTRVVLWTRFVSGSPTPLRVEVADDETFSRIVMTGEVEASPATDFCAHAIVEGLAPGRWYFYRFVSPDRQVSATGRTRTLPTGNVDRFRIAVFSCSNGTSGWFNAYAHAAARDDIDLAIHTGDYIYEFPLTRADAQPGIAAARGLAPPGEIVHLADYRQRYASYHADPDLTALHQRLPMIAVWDDHETANNSWRDGASAHDPATEGDWFARRSAGLRAWREWLPMPSDWYGTHRIGNLATLFRMETRLLGRTQAARRRPGRCVRCRRRSQVAAVCLRSGPTRRSQPRHDGPPAGATAGRRPRRLGVSLNALADPRPAGASSAPTRFPKATDAWIKGGITPELRAELDKREMLTAAGMPYSLDKPGRLSRRADAPLRRRTTGPRQLRHAHRR